MTVASYSTVRNNFKHYCDIAIQDRDPVVITNQNRDNVVLVSQEDWDSLVETVYIASDANKMKRLKQSIDEYHSGEGEQYDDVASMRAGLLQ